MVASLFLAPSLALLHQAMNKGARLPPRPACSNQRDQKNPSLFGL